jgi:sugar lactone lactonase YvrE
LKGRLQVKLGLKWTIWLVMTILAVGVAKPASAQEKGGEDQTGPYNLVPDWLKPIPNNDAWTFGFIYGVYAETPDRIFILQGGELPAPKPADKDIVRGSNKGLHHAHFVFIVNRNGEFVEAWTQWDSLFTRAHKVQINPYDPEKHIWIVDDGGHCVFEFTHDGKTLVKTIGEKGVQGEDNKHFGRPTEMAFLPDGTFYVTDGYINTRVVKFDKDGNYLMAWGTKGTGPSQFNLVHGLAIDAKRRLYILDRSNHRVQIFDENGKYLDEWDNLPSPTSIIITQDQFAWVEDSATNRILKYDLNGKLLTYWGVGGKGNAGFDDPHTMTVDSEGNLYVADVYNETVKKFVPKPNADPARLVGRPFVLPAR